MLNFKNIKMKKILILLALVVAFGSCDEGFEEMNVNPTKPTQLEPKLKLTYAQLATNGQDGIRYLFGNLIYVHSVTQYISTLWADGVYYTENDSRTSQVFDFSYPTAVKTVVDLVNQLENAEDSSTKDVDLAIAQVQKVLIFSRITDLYGDIPYSEAGRGFIDGIRFPKYDKQSEIYADMLAKLEAAAAVLKNGGTSSYGSADIFFNGDASKWNKFTNSLMLRLAMRMVKVDNAGAEAWATKAINGGLMESNADIAYLKYDAISAKWDIQGNPFIQSIATRANTQVRMMSTFVDAMKDKGDPRLAVWCSLSNGSTDSADQMGMPPGFGTTDVGALPNTDIHAYSMPNIDVVGTGDNRSNYNQPFILQSYAEVEFMLAEAAERWGLAGGDVQGHYETAVRAAMKQLSLFNNATLITDGQVDTYLSANPFNASDALEMIGNQYWLTVFPNAIEGWQNWKRTGFPALVPVDSDRGVTGGVIPRRLPYTNAEKLNNTANVEAASAQQGGDLLTTRMWWDVN